MEEGIEQGKKEVYVNCYEYAETETYKSDNPLDEYSCVIKGSDIFKEVEKIEKVIRDIDSSVPIKSKSIKNQTTVFFELPYEEDIRSKVLEELKKLGYESRVAPPTEQKIVLGGLSDNSLEQILEILKSEQQNEKLESTESHRSYSEPWHRRYSGG